MKPETADAMDALFALSEAMNKGVSTADLQEAMTLAIARGHDMLAIQLTMAQVAIEGCRQARRAVG